MFHERKQGPGKSVDSYAKDVRQLFREAYPNAQQGTSEAESPEQSVLAYQFVAGLGLPIKEKLAGCEGTFEQLLLKARFEEAMIRDLICPSPVGDVRPRSGHPRPSDKETHSGDSSKPARGVHCYNCDQLGHFAQSCPQHNQRGQSEAPGRSRTSHTVAQVASEAEQQQLAGEWLSFASS